MKFLAIMVAFGVVVSADAQMVLDDFTSGPASIEVSSGNTFYEQSGSMVGGSRVEEMEVDSNPFGVGLQVDVNNGFSSVSEGPDLVSTPAIGYGYHASADHQSFTTFDLGLNLSAQDAFELDFAYDETAMSGEITINQDQSASFSVNPTTGAEAVKVNFADFGSGIDWSDVHQIAITFDDPASNDFTMTKVQATPEPASLFALGLGAVGLLARKRRR